MNEDMHGYLVVDEDLTEWIFEHIPVIHSDLSSDLSSDKPYWKVQDNERADDNWYISLPKGTVKSIIGFEITHEHGPVKLIDNGKYYISANGTVKSYDPNDSTEEKCPIRVMESWATRTRRGLLD